VFTAKVPTRRTTLDHLNPQLQERFVPANVAKAARARRWVERA
jgi:hypothetical protein